MLERCSLPFCFGVCSKSSLGHFDSFSRLMIFMCPKSLNLSCIKKRKASEQTGNNKKDCCYGEYDRKAHLAHECPEGRSNCTAEIDEKGNSGVNFWILQSSEQSAYDAGSKHHAGRIKKAENCSTCIEDKGAGSAKPHKYHAAYASDECCDEGDFNVFVSNNAQCYLAYCLSNHHYGGHHEAYCQSIERNTFKLLGVGGELICHNIDQVDHTSEHKDRIEHRSFISLNRLNTFRLTRKCKRCTIRKAADFLRSSANAEQRER